MEKNYIQLRLIGEWWQLNMFAWHKALHLSGQKKKLSLKIILTFFNVEIHTVPNHCQVAYVLDFCELKSSPQKHKISTKLFKCPSAPSLFASTKEWGREEMKFYTSICSTKMTRFIQCVSPTLCFSLLSSPLPYPTLLYYLLSQTLETKPSGNPKKEKRNS